MSIIPFLKNEQSSNELLCEDACKPICDCLHFKPRYNQGTLVVKRSSMPRDLSLMIKNPNNYIDCFKLIDLKKKGFITQKDVSLFLKTHGIEFELELTYIFCKKIIRNTPHVDFHYFYEYCSAFSGFNYKKPGLLTEEPIDYTETDSFDGLYHKSLIKLTVILIKTIIETLKKQKNIVSKMLKLNQNQQNGFLLWRKLNEKNKHQIGYDQPKFVLNKQE